MSYEAVQKMQDCIHEPLDRDFSPPPLSVRVSPSSYHRVNASLNIWIG
jgi:hypothetical protein